MYAYIYSYIHRNFNISGHSLIGLQPGDSIHWRSQPESQGGANLREDIDVLRSKPSFLLKTAVVLILKSIWRKIWNHSDGGLPMICFRKIQNHAFPLKMNMFLERSKYAKSPHVRRVEPSRTWFMPWDCRRCYIVFGLCQPRPVIARHRSYYYIYIYISTHTYALCIECLPTFALRITQM